MQCRNQPAPVTHQDQGCRPERVRMTPLAAMAAPENRRGPARVHVARLAPMTDLCLLEGGASGTNPWWLRAEANRSSRAERRTAAQSGLMVVSQPRAWFTASAPFLRRMPAAVKRYLLPHHVIAGARRGSPRLCQQAICERSFAIPGTTRRAFSKANSRREGDGISSALLE